MTTAARTRRRELEIQLGEAVTALYRHREVLHRERTGDLAQSLAESDRLLRVIPIIEASLVLAKEDEASAV
jgi:hypothetical protein